MILKVVDYQHKANPLRGFSEKYRVKNSIVESKRINLVRLAGIEPTTLGFGGQYSIH
jgi:hypothetical protein